MDTQRRGSVKVNHPADNLLAVLPRWASWVLSTSDVERGFSVTSSLRGGSSEDLNFQREEEILMIKTANISDPKKLITEAMRLWARYFGPSRAKPICAKFTQGVTKDNAYVGEKGFLSVRGKITASLADGLGDLLPKRFDLSRDEDLTERHHKELMFNKQKETKSRVEALLSNNLLDEEITDVLIDDAKKHVIRLAKAQNALTTMKKRHIKRAIKAEHDISDAVVWFDRTETGNISDCELHRVHVRKTMERHEADIFVVKELNNCSAKVKFVASLVGGTIATCDYVRYGGKLGAAIAYSKAVAVKRLINVSPEFMRLHPYICSDLNQVLQHTYARWTLTSIPDIFAYLGPAGAARNRKQKDVIVFVSQAERESEDPLMYN